MSDDFQDDFSDDMKRIMSLTLDISYRNTVISLQSD